MFILTVPYYCKPPMETYLVGGAVRDHLLNLPVKDKDWVIVGAKPEQLMALGYKQVGADFPVFLHPKTKEEFALARTERKSGHGYKGFDVSFDSNVTLNEDLERRDLTINAIAQDERGKLIDPFNGQADIEQKRLRHVSDAFREDPLRVLRIARFSARFYHLGFTIADDTNTLLREMVQSGELEHLVQERVWAETSRALTTQTPSEYFRVLKRIGALKIIFPELDRLFGVPQPFRWHPEVDTGIHTLKTLEIARSRTDNIDVLMAAVCHDLGKGLTSADIIPSHRGHEGKGADLIKRIAKNYRWPVKTAILAENVARYHTHCHNIFTLKPSSILKLLTNINAFRNEEQADLFTMVCEADALGRSGFESSSYPQRNFLLNCLTLCNTVNAQEFIEQGITGKAIGESIMERRIQLLKQLKKESSTIAAPGR